MHTFPARGILKGSVQKTSFFDRASKEELTAMVSSIGNSGGMTEVTIIVQFRKSLKRLRSGSCRAQIAAGTDAVAESISLQQQGAVLSSAHDTLLWLALTTSR